MSILEIANLIKKEIPCKILISKINDIRSYRLDSSKLIKTGYKPKFKVKDAILEIKNLYENKKLKISKNNFSVKWLKYLINKKLNDKISL